MTEQGHPPLLVLGGLLGYRLACDTDQGRSIVWTLEHPVEQVGHLLLDHSLGRPAPASGRPELFPCEIEQVIFSPLLQHFSAGSSGRKLLLPLLDWRLSARDQCPLMLQALPREGQIDVVTHSWGLHLLLALLGPDGLGIERIRRVILVTPPFGGSLDSLVALRCGIDRLNVGSGRDMGWLTRSFPALFDLLPEPGYGMVRNQQGDELDLLAESSWPRSLGHSLRPLLMAAGAFRYERQCRIKRFLPALADRCLVLAGCGMDTALELRLPAGEIVWDCDPAFLSMGTQGDGRLPLVSTMPREPVLTRLVLGDTGQPVCHGEIFYRPGVLQLLESWLDNGEIKQA